MGFLFFLWFVISIAFIVTLIITIVKAARRKKVKGILISTIILFLVGLICFIGAVATTPEDDDYSVQKGDDSNVSKASSSSNDDSNKKKTLHIGDTLRVGGVDVKVAKAEFVQSDNEYSTPKKGRILKVSYEFKNNGDDQVLAADDDFNLTVDSETQKEFFGMDDTDDGFSEFLNKGNTISGYTYYDVPEADEYKAELNFDPGMETYKANWIIKNSDIQ